MKIHNMSYLCKSGVKNVFSARTMSFASIGVLVACFLLIGLSFLSALVIDRIADEIGGQSEMTVYLDENIDDTDTAVMESKLRALTGISDILYQTKEDNLFIMCDKLGETPESLLSNPQSDNPFLSSFTLRVSEPEQFEAYYQRISNMSGVAAVKGSAKAANALVGIKKVVSYVSFGVIIILIAVSMLIVSNTIRITVFSRRNEISIMKYVGATDTFIRTPFIIEGILIGLIAAALACAILILCYHQLPFIFGQSIQSGYIADMVMRKIQFDIYTWVNLFAGCCTVGGIVGSIGGAVFVRKYLRV